MNKETKRILLLLGIVTSSAIGYYIYIKKNKKKKIVNTNEEVTSNEDTIKSSDKDVDANVDNNDNKGFISTFPEEVKTETVDYTQYYEEVKKYNPNLEETDENDEEEEWEGGAFIRDNIYNEYKKKNKDKIVVLSEKDAEYTWNNYYLGNDPEYPDVIYDSEELYYFTEDDTLTDEEGNIVDEEEYIGKKPRQFGWFANDSETIYIRNNSLEKDFRVNKVPYKREDYF